MATPIFVKPLSDKFLSRILAIFCEKGGIGKTTTALNTTWFAADVHKMKVLAVELDAQGNTTNTLTSEVPRNALTGSMLFKEELPANKKPIEISPNIHLIAADKQLKKVDSYVQAEDKAAARELYHIVRNNLRKLAVNYDLIVIDTPPTAELRYTAALVAADSFVTPTTMDAFGMDGIASVAEIERDVKSIYGNPRLKNIGILPNKVQKRSALNNNMLDQLKQANMKTTPMVIYLRSDIENKLYEGKRSPHMREACEHILAEVMK
ncbi:ParA family protein (plasmid) [Pseudoduganella sp. UC29_106]|uniref:ParA family protein n=1 Tax=Pseudoduganella sp. UC29_106 TaxID=3374553 RepID=UPI003757C976